MNNNLKYKNKFNTYQRFTDHSGLQKYENGIGIDHYLGIEVLELKPKEIEMLIAYNRGELWWGEVEPVTDKERALIEQTAERYKEWDDIVNQYGNEYNYSKPIKSEVKTDYSHYGEFALLCAKWNRLFK